MVLQKWKQLFVQCSSAHAIFLRIQLGVSYCKKGKNIKKLKETLLFNSGAQSKLKVNVRVMSSGNKFQLENWKAFFVCAGVIERHATSCRIYFFLWGSKDRKKINQSFGLFLANDEDPQIHPQKSLYLTRTEATAAIWNAFTRLVIFSSTCMYGPSCNDDFWNLIIYLCVCRSILFWKLRKISPNGKHTRWRRRTWSSRLTRSETKVQCYKRFVAVSTSKSHSIKQNQQLTHFMPWLLGGNRCARVISPIHT